MALAAHSTGLPRAWSKYSKATQQSQEDLAASGAHGTGKSREERQAEETKRRDAVIAGKAEVLRVYIGDDQVWYYLLYP